MTRLSRLNRPKNIVLLLLPPHSPEFNPVENVWQYVRQYQPSLQV
jgi:transposase